DQTKLDRVFGDTEHDGDGRCCAFGRECCGEASGRDDHCDLPANQLARQLRQLFDPLGPAVVDRYVLALDIACLSETLAKRAQTLDNRLGRSDFEKPYHRHRRLLRARRERPRRRAAEQRDECAALHSITSSARASSVGGTSMPRAFAVLRLIARSYLVGACT